MKCAKCIERGQTWQGSPPVCAWDRQPHDNWSFRDNWNCATLNEIRDLEGSPLADYRWSEDQKYLTILIDGVELPRGRTPMALWVSWYKSRGRTDAVWLLYYDRPPEQPDEADLLAILAHVTPPHRALTGDR